MRSSSIPFLLVVAAAVVAASPAQAPAPAWIDHRAGHPLNQLSIRDHESSIMDVRHEGDLEKRLSATFALNRQWDNEVLFGGSWVDAGATDAEAVSLSVTCVECWTKGLVTAKLTTEDILEPVVQLAFDGVEAYIDLDLRASAGATYAINLFSTDAPQALHLPDLDVGVIFSLDLVFSVSATIDLEGGFYVKLSDDAYLDTDLFGGSIADSFFDGIQTKSLPVTVRSGAATFKADLRLRVQCGAEADLDIFGIGAGAVVGIYANLLEFVAVLDSTPSCGLQTREWFDVNVGAYAHLDVEVDYKTMAVVPTVSTTLFDSPTYTQCLLDGVAVASGTGTAAYVTASTMSGSLSASSYGGASHPISGTGSSLVASSTFPGTDGFPSLTSRPHPTFTPSSAHSRPLGNSSATPTSGDLVTSTVYSTTEYTVTSCAASVVNCPASLAKQIVVTSTLDAYTTVCPTGASITMPPSSQSTAGVTAVHVITELIVIPKVSPKTETFVEPTTAKPKQPKTSTGTPLRASTTLALPAVNQAKAQEIKAAGYHNGTSTVAHSTSSYGTGTGTGAILPSTTAPSVPMEAGANGKEATRLSGVIGALAVLAGVAVVM